MCVVIVVCDNSSGRSGCSNRKESLRAADGIADIGQQTIQKAGMYRLETSKTTRRLEPAQTNRSLRIFARLHLPPSSINKTRRSEQLSFSKFQGAA